MKNSLDMSSIAKSFSTFLKRFHTILFFLVVSSGLFAAIAMLLGIISLSDTTATSSTQTIDGTFDEITIGQLSNPTSTQASPGDRVSPFVE